MPAQSTRDRSQAICRDILRQKVLLLVPTVVEPIDFAVLSLRDSDQEICSESLLIELDHCRWNTLWFVRIHSLWLYYFSYLATLTS